MISCWVGVLIRNATFGVPNGKKRGVPTDMLCPGGVPAGRFWRGHERHRLGHSTLASPPSPLVVNLTLSEGEMVEVPKIHRTMRGSSAHDLRP